MDLTITRGTYRGQVTRLSKAAGEYLSGSESQLTAENLVNADTIEEELKVYIQRLEAAHQSLSKVNVELRSNASMARSEENDRVAEYEDLAIGVLARLSSRLSKLKEKCSSHFRANTSVPVPVQRSATKLPKLQLKTFNGDFKNWLPFWEQFRSTVHENPSLTRADKFIYLQSLLSGNAFKVIAGFTQSEECYDGAIALLTEEFGNTEKLIDKHMQQLMALPAVRTRTDVKGLRSLYTNVIACSRSLTSLGVPSTHYYVMLKSILLRCLPTELRIEYHRLHESAIERAALREEELLDDSQSASSTVSLDGDRPVRSILNFIKREVESLEKAAIETNKVSSQKSSPYRSTPTAAGLIATNTRKTCFFCQSSTHTTLDCNAFTLTERKQKLTKAGRCYRCTNRGHLSKGCKVKGIICKNCAGYHPTSMCDPNYTSKKKESSIDDSNQQESSCRPVLNLCTHFSKRKLSTVFLQTACAIASKVNFNNGLFIRMIIDSGSHYSYVTEAVAMKLNLEVVKMQRLSVVGFGNKESSPARDFKEVKLRLRSQFDSKNIVIHALVVPEICADVLAVPNKAHADLRKFNVADSNVYNLQSAEGIGLLIGSDSYWQVLTGSYQRLSNKLAAVETIFGWVLQGPSLDNEMCVNLSENNVTLAALYCADGLEFWKLELLGIENEEKPSYISRNDAWRNLINYRECRYEVSLPWKIKDGLQLDSYRDGALKRLRSLTRKLSREPKKLMQYDKAMRDFILAGFAERVNNEMEGKNIYYLPHRPVYRDDKTTTKLRIVFDASAHIDSKLSLNDCLHTGDNLLPDIFMIMLNFRFGSIGLVADIEKAFLQISLVKEDRDSHRFFWYSNPVHSESTPTSYECYRMTRVTFGITSSPFQLCATLRAHFDSKQEEYPYTCPILRQFFYMDDLICSVYSLTEAQKIYKEAKHILTEASMNLRQWNCNNKVLRSNFDSKVLPHMQKVLGMKWYVLSDELGLSVDRIEHILNEKLDATKRNVLQLMSRIYDPLGVVGPVTIRLKILFQKLWKIRAPWDDVIAGQLLLEFRSCCDDILLLREMFIPRCIHASRDHQSVELHIFADASLQAYGAAAYVKVIDSYGDVSVKLLCARNRVVPIKEDGENELTLPRLELTAALIAARLCSYLKRAIKMDFTSCYLWTDSMITLYWIKNENKKWKPYVDNRTKEIRRHTKFDEWRHCSGKSNPADLLTRGISAKLLLSSSLWINGPDWLQVHRKYDITDISPEVELNPTIALLTKSDEVYLRDTRCPISYIEFSNWQRLLRVTSWVFMFIRSFRRNHPEGAPCFVSENIELAEDYWIRFVQNENYKSEIYSLKQGRYIEKSSKILELSPFLDDNGILRLGGRLQFLEDEVDIIHPIILPKNSHITKLIILDIHQRSFHSGVSHVLNQLRKRFWVPKGRQLVKSLIKSCVVCKKLFGEPAYQPFPPIPKERIAMSRPFDTIGVDFAGPLYTKEGSTNQNPKCYVMIFTCAVIRAVHLELVPSMSTNDCLLALRRFIARRGLPRKIISDNAKTFKKSKSELLRFKEVLKSDEFTGFLGLHKIKWRFIVERAPWWGGFWERLIRSVKNLLKAVISKSKLDFNELQTILAEAESIINSRPLTYVSSDPLELSPLTPSDFLLHSRNFSPDTELEEAGAVDLQNKWKSRLEVTRKLWRRWKSEYLQLLRSLHHVRHGSSKDIKRGEVVLIHDQMKPRLLWKLAIVEETFTGRDGRVRAVQVRLGDGSLLRRPVQLLYPLEIS